MPRMDGTGPAGQGPRTGRGLGNCTTPPNAPWRFLSLGGLLPRRGTRRGRGRGRGRR